MSLVSDPSVPSHTEENSRTQALIFCKQHHVYQVMNRTTNLNVYNPQEPEPTANIKNLSRTFEKEG